jgi:hypothetical protein
MHRFTVDIAIDGVRFEAGQSVPPEIDAGYIAAMLRLEQIEPYSPPLQSPESAPVKTPTEPKAKK